MNKTNFCLQPLFALLLLISLLPVQLPAIDLQDNNRLVTDRFSDGWFFDAGVGFNFSFLNSNNTDPVFSIGGGGLNTSVGYHLNKYVALEFGSQITVSGYQTDFIQSASQFIPDSEIYMLNSFFHIGVRTLLPTKNNSPYWNPYLRMFHGINIGTARVYDIDEDNLSDYITANGGDQSDVQTIIDRFSKHKFAIEGIGFGWAFGNYFNLGNSNAIWFIELSFTLVIYWKQYAVDTTDPVLPQIVEIRSTSGNEHYYSALLSVGVRFF